MGKIIRLLLIFLWCVFFGFFSVMSYLDDTMTTQKTTVILVGLVLILGAYLTVEWFTRSKSGNP